MTPDRHDAALPAIQYAVQLIGPRGLVLNRSKDVPRPGAHQIVVKVEAVGLCFSDLKLLNQFSAHPRKGEIVSGIAPEVLGQISSYVPGELPTVPGHEVSCRIVAVGREVTGHRVGERCLVQTDYRNLPTKGSNAAFGYNFEGGLQEYVLMDERVVVDAGTGTRSLIAVSEEPSASAVALVEPWACVESSYSTTNRRKLAPGGRLLVVVEDGHSVMGLAEAMQPGQAPASVTIVAAAGVDCDWAGPDVVVTRASDVHDLADAAFDDVVYFGASKPTIDALNDKLAVGAIINIVLAGATIGEPVSVGVGRVHYEATRWVGTAGCSAEESYATIPLSGELRPGDRVLAVGAAGPMGQMHVFRSLSAGVDRLTVVGTDLDDARLESLRAKAEPLAQANGVSLRLLNPSTEPVAGTFSYHLILVPVPSLVADAVLSSRDRGLINIFAGIAVATRQEIDLDAYIARRCYMFGTSGSVVRDMEVLLNKIAAGQLDTNMSLDAISGMAGAEAGLAALRDGIMAGKIVIYPSLHEVGLLSLAELGGAFPTVASKLEHGHWCAEAERELLKVARSQAPALADDQHG
ncbi:MAG: alcohol dehydrogenase catalytic domain-containing protein [Acidimicrobiales bacterium]|jgi:threonine dehydrogenase-like Zn-dependent dehydrogenase